MQHRNDKKVFKLSIMKQLRLAAGNVTFDIFRFYVTCKNFHLRAASIAFGSTPCVPLPPPVAPPPRCSIPRSRARLTRRRRAGRPPAARRFLAALLYRTRLPRSSQRPGPGGDEVRPGLVQGASGVSVPAVRRL